VNAFPEGAKALDKDFKLPLHWAIETGKEWNEGIQSLVEAAPLALATRDGQNHLYPFMMAAMISNVSLTFKLLLAKPHDGAIRNWKRIGGHIEGPATEERTFFGTKKSKIRGKLTEKC
jgi:ankyrin repeat protein